MICAASGNENQSNVNYPAAYSGVIAVGATNQIDLRCSPSDWGTERGSNYGTQLSVVAPGNSIYSTCFDGASNSTYEYLSGTSMAAPHVAGAAALILSLDQTLSPAQVKGILEGSATKVAGMGGQNFHIEYGYGRINVVAALVNTNPSNISFEFINRIESATSYGTLVIDNDKLHPITSGSCRTFAVGSNHVVRTNELPFCVNWGGSGFAQKHHRFYPIEYADFSLSHQFSADVLTPETQDANFLRTSPAAVTTQLIDAPDALGGSIQLRDPWRYYKDQNDDWWQTNEYISYGAPFVMNNNTLESYGGVFLDQDPVQTPTYYSVRVPLEQPDIAGFRGFFRGWEATDADLVVPQQPPPAGYTERIPVFRSGDAVVKAKYKAHFGSSSPAATGPNGQRKLVDDGYWSALAYPSSGRVWFTDGGPNWTNEDMLDSEDGTSRSPSFAISPYTYEYCIVWEQLHSNYRGIWTTDGPHLVPAPHLIASINPHAEIEAAPVVAVKQSIGGVPGNVEPVTSVVAAWTSAAGIDTAFRRDQLWGSGLLAANCYRPSLSMSVPCMMYGGLVNAVYFSYDNNLGVWWRKLYTHRAACAPPGEEEEKLEEEIPYFDRMTEPVAIQGSCSGTFSGKSQIDAGECNPAVVWEMHEPVQPDTVAPDCEEIGGEIVEEPAVLLHGLEVWSVCFARPEGVGVPVKKFAGSSFQNPTVLNLSNNRVVMLWDDGANLWQAVSRNNGLSWTDVGQIGGGRFPNLVNRYDLLPSAVKYVYTQSSGSLYRVAMGEVNTSGSGEEDESVTHEISVSEPEGAGLSMGNRGALVIEMPRLRIKTSTGSAQVVDFAPEAGSTFTLENIESYLSTPVFTVPATAESISIGLRMRSVSAGRLAGQGSPLRVRVRFTPNYGTARFTAGIWRFTGNHGFNKTVRIPAQNLRNRTLRLEVTILGLDRGRSDLTASAATVYYPAGSLSRKNAGASAAQASSELPTEFALAQNYPNPFNPLTIVNYQLPIDNWVTIKVYDMLGREVRTLVDGYREAGYYQVELDACDLASGVYLYRMLARSSSGTNAGTYSAVRKFIVMK